MPRFFTPNWPSSSSLLHASSKTVLALLLGAVLGSGVAFAHAQASTGSRGLLPESDTALHDLVVAARPPASYLAHGADGSPARDPRSFITIVAIDERTLDELGAYNGGYPRAYHAQVIEALLAAPPRAIAVDLGFFEPTPEDGLLASALDRARNLPVPTSVVLAAAGLDREPTTAGTGAATRYARGLMPTEVLAERADIALANVLPDERGTIRVTALTSTVANVERPALGLAGIARYLRRAPTLDGPPADGAAHFAGRAMPVNAAGAARINFFGPPSRPYAPEDTYRVVSFVDVLRGRVDPNVWRAGLVFIGALGATGLADDYWTPASQDGHKMAGVEIHANVAATLFSTSFLHELDTPRQIGLIVAIAIFLALLAIHLDLLVVGILCPLVLLGYVALAAWALYANGLILPISAPVVAGAAAVLGAAAPRAIRAHRRARSLALTLAAERAEAAVQARHDSLTGLMNRPQLLRDLQHAVEVEQQRGGLGALLLLNVDRFKDVNDALGHSVGDALLVDVSSRLRQLDLGPNACLARVGGDEFAVVLPDAQPEAAISTSVLLLRALEVPFEAGGQELSVSASVGIVAFPRHGAEPEMLLRRADVAVQRAKETGSGYSTYSGQQDEPSTDRLALVTSLRRAITADELLLFCQPKVDCRSGQLAAVEALVRWQHPQRGMIPPDQFIPLAEKTGLIRPLSRWVLAAAVRHARAWMDAGLHVPVAVNLSTHDLQDLELPSFLENLLHEAQVPAELFIVEITETALLADPGRAQEVLERICALGAQASLDDFGTGYSSLTYLKQFPLEELKIDRSFVRDLARGPRDREIVRSTIELGHRLGLHVVAEGVEDGVTLEALAELGCDLAQGYYIGRPMPCAELPEWVRARNATEHGARNAA